METYIGNFTEFYEWKSVLQEYRQEKKQQKKKESEKEWGRKTKRDGGN